MGTPQQSFLLQRIQVSSNRHHRNIQLLAQRFHRNPPGLLEVRQNRGKAHLLLVLRNGAFRLRLPTRGHPRRARRLELAHSVLPGIDCVQNETSEPRFSFDFGGNEIILLSMVRPNSQYCKKIESVTRHSLERGINFVFGHFRLKTIAYCTDNNTRMIDWQHCSAEAVLPKPEFQRYRVSRGKRMTLDRRQFVTALLVSGAATAVRAPGIENSHNALPPDSPTANSHNAKVDFRYAPHHAQSTICFPDDPLKTIVGQAGDLRYGFAKSLLVGMEDFSTVIDFSLAGFQDDKVLRQWIEAPGIPIVHTLIERPAATLELTAFATRHASEGRVDNVLLTIRAKKGSVAVVPKLHIHTCDKLVLESYTVPTATVSTHESKSPLLVAGQLHNDLGTCMMWEEAGFTLYLPHGTATEEHEARYFVRLPQENQSAAALQEHLQDPEMLLAEAREFWSKWKPFGATEWAYPQRQGEFLTACARNIQQAREVKNGQLVFQVGPTVYRGLWIVDGNFLLEAARYLGYDQAADEGLRSEWSKQVDSGQIIAAGGGEHWKDTAIAMFTLVRQCELKQDWTFFRDLEPNVVRALDFLISLRDQARSGKKHEWTLWPARAGFCRWRHWRCALRVHQHRLDPGSTPRRRRCRRSTEDAIARQSRSILP